MSTLAIDIGTSNSCAYVTIGNASRVVQDNDDHLIPSIIRYNRDGSVMCCGTPALIQYWNATNIVRCFKRIIGYRMNTREMHDYMNNCLCKVVEGPDGFPAFDMEAFAGRELTPTIVTSHLIKYIADLAVSQTDQPINELVITVPAFFDNVQREEVKKAILLSGVCPEGHFKLVSEPVAAALEYGIVNGVNNKTVMVIDCGGGTTDICVMEINDRVYNVIATHGHNHLGGDDVTNIFREKVEQKYEEYYQEPLIKAPRNAKLYRVYEEELKSKVEEAKKAFSTKQEVTIEDLVLGQANIGDDSDDSDSDSDSDEDGNHRELTISRREFDQVIHEFVTTVVDLTRQTLQKINMRKEQIDDVILVGGSCRLLALQEALKDEYNNRVKIIDNPDECVARGALRASTYEKNRAGIQLFEVIGQNYGFPVFDEFKHKDVFMTLIPRNTRYPSDQVFSQKLYLVRRSNGSYLDYADVDLFQSLNGTMEDSMQLASFGIEGATPTGDPIDVRFTIDENGFINVEIVQTCDGRVLLQKCCMIEVQTERQ